MNTENPMVKNEDPDSGLHCGQMTKAELLLWMNVQYWTEGILFSFVGAVGFIGNLISIAILLTQEMRKHSFNQMLIGLAFFDLCFITCGVPVHITPIFGLENRLYAFLYAYFLYPFTAVSLTGSIYMTMAITIERFMAVCHPHYYRDVTSRITPLKRVLMYAIPVSTFAIVVNIPKFLETKVHYDQDGEVQYDVTELRLNPTYIWWYTLSYVCHPLLTTTVGPFCVLTVLNYRIYKGIKKARTNVSSSNRHGEMNLARVLVTICVVFLLCNSLRLFLGLQAIINVDITITCVSKNKAWIPPSWMLIMESVSHLLLLISSSTNFLIYCTISTKFKIYIKTKFCWRSSPRVDVPEVNSRIALRTLNKSGNEGSGNQGANKVEGPPNMNQNCSAAAPAQNVQEEGQENNDKLDQRELAQDDSINQLEEGGPKDEEDDLVVTTESPNSSKMTTVVIVETPPLGNNSHNEATLSPNHVVLKLITREDERQEVEETRVRREKLQNGKEQPEEEDAIEAEPILNEDEDEDEDEDDEEESCFEEQESRL